MQRLLSRTCLALFLAFVSSAATAQSAADRELRAGTPYCVEIREERDFKASTGGTYYSIRGTNCSMNDWIVRVCTTAGRDNREGCASLYMRAGGRSSTTILSFNGVFYVRGHRPYPP
jgi:hypothetical protein